MRWVTPACNIHDASFAVVCSAMVRSASSQFTSVSHCCALQGSDMQRQRQVFAGCNTRDASNAQIQIALRNANTNTNTVQIQI